MDDVLYRFAGRAGALAVVVSSVLLLLAEAGYRRGLRLHAAGDKARRAQIGGVQSAVLGMFALLLGFTFSMAVVRYEQRRALVLQEANAIGTAWLRAGLLPDIHRQPVRHLLREYVDIRLRAQDALRDAALMTDLRRQSAAIHSALWRHAEASGIDAPNDMTATFIEALNAVIDIDEERVAASRNTIPAGVWVILLVVAGVGCWTSGYGAGADGVRSALTGAVLPLLASVVMFLILDLNNERRGIISVSQQPLLDLQESMRSAAAFRPSFEVPRRPSSGLERRAWNRQPPFHVVPPDGGSGACGFRKNPAAAGILILLRTCLHGSPARSRSTRPTWRPLAVRTAQTKAV
jgi:hypothetical protein